MKFTFYLFLILAGFVAKAQTDTDKKAILSILDDQTQAWNKADIQAFMQGYWQSDSLRFVGSNGIQYGWKATLERYQKSYPDKASMGKLHFEIVSTELLSSNAAFVIGKWFLERPKKGNINGHFTLLWRKIKGKWLIVADHSS